MKCYINKKKQVRNKDKEGEVIKNTEERLRGMGNRMRRSKLGVNHSPG